MTSVHKEGTVIDTPNPQPDHTAPNPINAEEANNIKTSSLPGAGTDYTSSITTWLTVNPIGTLVFTYGALLIGSQFLV